VYVYAQNTKIKFSKVSSLLNILHEITKELTCENILTFEKLSKVMSLLNKIHEITKELTFQNIYYARAFSVHIRI